MLKYLTLNYYISLGVDQVINQGVSEISHLFDYQPWLCWTQCYKNANGQAISADWASSYKQWMTDYLNSRSSDATAWALQTASDLGKSTDSAIQTRLLTYAASPYSKSGFFSFDFGLTWSGNAIQMRSLQERDPSCTLETSSTSTLTVPNSPQTQSALPIASPVCRSNSAPAIPSSWNIPKTGDVDANALLFIMREVPPSSSSELS